MSRRRHDRTRLSQCARDEMASSRGIGNLLNLESPWSSALGYEEEEPTRRAKL